MKINIEMKDPYIQCDCGRDVESYDTELTDSGDGEISIKFYGWCPRCKKEYVWRSKYQFVSGTITACREGNT